MLISPKHKLRLMGVSLVLKVLGHKKSWRKNSDQMIALDEMFWDKC